jgi:transcriptional regulator with PAS, ATPase and Fis domain
VWRQRFWYFPTGGDSMGLIENNSRVIFDKLDAQIYLIDQHYKIIDFNKAFADHVKLARENIIGQPCHKLTHNSDIPCWEMENTICPARSAFEKNEKRRVIHKHIIKNKIIVEEVISTPIDNAKYILEEFRDLSELLGLVQGFLPICIRCKKIRAQNGNWYHIEGYLHDKTGADFSHALCPECAKRLYPEFRDKDTKE